MTVTNSAFWNLLQVQVLQISILIIIVGVLGLLLGQRHPHIVFALWAVVFVKCLTPPLMISPVALFAWQPPAAARPSCEPAIPVIGRFDNRGVSRTLENSAHDPLSAGANALPAAPKPALSGSATPSVPEISGTPRFDARQETGGFQPSPEPVVSGRSVSTSPRHGTSSWLPDSSGNGSGMAEILVVVWLSGIAIISGRAIRQWLRFLATIRASRIPADRRLKECVNVVKRQLKFRRAVRLVVINHNYGPLVFGYLHPVLVLPWSLVQQSSTRELQPVIAHELIHVRRGDTLLCLLQFLARTIWWFNPLVGWASRATDELAERCCDLDVVNGLPCKATDYVRSLLRIIEMCQAPIGVAGTVGLRPADITIRRLRWLALQRPGRSPARGWSSWLVASAAALLVYPAAGSPPQQEHPKIRDAQQAVSSRDQEANQAFDSQNWESAARLYQSIVVENPDNGLAWFRLGYSLQAVGKLDEAIFAHEKASAFPRGRKTALYNWACALSRKGEYEAALDKLGEALDAGFLRPAALDEDADFAPLLENERFKQLVKRHQELVIIADAADSGRHAGIMSTEGPRSGSSIRVVDASALEQMAFWSGNWKITDVDGNQLGSAVVTLDEKEHWYVEQWSGSDGSTGTGKLLYDPASQLWIENFEGSGKKFNLAGSLTGKTLELSGDITIDGQRRMSGRLNLVRLEDGRLHLTMTSSADDGQTWTPVSEVFYAKIDP